MPVIELKPGRERSLQRRHPWIYSGAIGKIHTPPAVGGTVEIRSASGDFLAWGAYSPNSQIRIRVWAWDRAQAIDEAFFRSRVEQACLLRYNQGLLVQTNAIRLVHAESDGLPGVIADLYGSTLVVQFLSAGAEYWRETLTSVLHEVTGADRVFERSDAEVRVLEGLPARIGQLVGNDLAAPVLIHENSIVYQVDVHQGHKTGFYLDQRSNRLRIREFSSGREVLDCFCYTGGFTLNALKGGASSVLAVDSSSVAIRTAQENLNKNQLPGDRVQFIEQDVFQALRTLRDRATSFDLIVLDPPKFAPTHAQVERAARGYKDINLLALKLLRPGGLLFTFSCSAGINGELFQKIVAGAALDAGINAQILEHLHQAPDHPIALNFPDGEYLKGLIISRGYH